MARLKDLTTEEISVLLRALARSARNTMYDGQVDRATTKTIVIIYSDDLECVNYISNQMDRQVTANVLEQVSRAVKADIAQRN